MAAKASKKDVILNMVYSLGASVVILGALFKINHWTVPFIGVGGSAILAVGLVTEAIIFIIFAFDTPAGEYDWERVHPELSDPNAKPVRKAVSIEAQNTGEGLSAKLDKMLAEAKLDSALISRLRDGIDNFSNSVNDINKTVDASRNTQKYGDQLALAANHMESLNSLYQVQLESGKKQVELNRKFIDEMQKSATGSEQFMQEMNKLTKNVNDLNKVYGGMLSAMRQPGV